MLFFKKQCKRNVIKKGNKQEDKSFNTNISKGLNSAKIIEPEQDTVLGRLLINPIKFIILSLFIYYYLLYNILIYINIYFLCFLQKLSGQNFNTHISKGHNSFKNHLTGTELRFAQLGMVLINFIYSINKIQQIVLEKLSKQFFHYKYFKGS